MIFHTASCHHVSALPVESSISWYEALQNFSTHCWDCTDSQSFRNENCKCHIPTECLHVCLFLDYIHHTKPTVSFKLVLNIAITLSSKTKLHATQVNGRLVHFKLYANVYLKKAEEYTKLNLTLIHSLRLMFVCAVIWNIVSWALAEILQNTAKKDILARTRGSLKKLYNEWSSL